MAYFVKFPGETRIKLTAGEALSTGDVVHIKSDGKAYTADSDGSSTFPARGVVGKGGASGATVEILFSGAVIGGFSSLTPGATQYLSATAGEVTETAPTNEQPCGFAVSATEILFDFGAYTAGA